MSPPQSVTDTSEIRILQHWAAEGTDPLVPVIDEFRRTNSGVAFDNRAEHVSSLRLIVKSEVLLEDPPEIWVEWPGKNLRVSVDAGVVADITEVWEDAGFVDSFVESAQEAACFDGRYRCLPTDMYRINNLFYNVDLVERAGVDVDSVDSPAAFVEMLASLDAAIDVPAMVLNGRDPFGPLQLWETLVIAHGGGRAYDQLLAGEGQRHRDVVRSAVETLDDILEYTPSDASFTSSSEADKNFVEGAGALAHNGGWAVGRMKTADNFEYGTDWEYTPFPGTGDVFQMNMNAIVPAAHVEGNDSVAAFLAHLASKQSLEHINGALGAVPPRGDVPVSNLHPVTQQHHNALSTTQHHVQSMAHGLGVTPDQVINLKNAVASFMRTRDVDEMTRDVVETL